MQPTVTFTIGALTLEGHVLAWDKARVTVSTMAGSVYTVSARTVQPLTWERA